MSPPDSATLDLLEALHAESFRWAMHCCGRDREHAADVLQSTYLKILEGRARHGGAATFRTWLFAVIRHTAASHFRKRALFRFMTPASGDDGAATDLPFEAADEDEPLDCRETARLLAGLKTLSPRQREVLLLVFYHDMSIRDAADILGVSIGTARQHYERAKAALRLWLSARGVMR